MLSDGAAGASLRRRARRAFHGTHATLAGSDLEALTSAIRLFEAKTGEHNPAYHLELAPACTSTVCRRPGSPWAFAPSLSFDLDELRLQLAHPPASVASNALVRTKAVDGTRTTTSTSTCPADMSVPSARRLAVVVAGIGIVLTLAAAAFLLPRRRDDELAAIERRSGDLIVPVAPGSYRHASERTVATIDALVPVAERYDRLILHETRAGGHSFLVDDAGVVFRYDIGSPPEETLRSGSTMRFVLVPPISRPPIDDPPSGTGRCDLLAVALIALIALEFSATNTVPASHAGRDQRTIGAQDIAPPQCAGMGLTTVITNLNGGNGNDLVLGTAAGETLTATTATTASSAAGATTP